MVYLEEITTFLTSSSVFTVIKITITIFLVAATIVLRKRLRPPEDHTTSKSTSDDFQDETEDETCGQELGLMGKLKSAKLREMEDKMSEEQKTKENEVQKQQLAAIFELVKKQQEDLKEEELSQDDFNAQLKLYR